MKPLLIPILRLTQRRPRQSYDNDSRFTSSCFLRHTSTCLPPCVNELQINQLRPITALTIDCISDQPHEPFNTQSEHY